MSQILVNMKSLAKWTEWGTQVFYFGSYYTNSIASGKQKQSQNRSNFQSPSSFYYLLLLTCKRAPFQFYQPSCFRISFSMNTLHLVISLGAIHSNLLKQYSEVSLLRFLTILCSILFIQNFSFQKQNGCYGLSNLELSYRVGFLYNEKYLKVKQQLNVFISLPFFLTLTLQTQEYIYNLQQYFYKAELMYYFIIPNYSMPNDFNWFIPVCQTYIENEINEEEIDVEDLKTNFSPIVLSKTVAKEIKPIIVSQPKPKNEKQPEKFKNTIIDQDYCPEIYISHKTKKMPQLENRNVVPNAVRLILSFIQKKGKSQVIVEKLFKEYGLKANWSSKRFYLYQNIVKSKLNNYVNEDTIKKLLRFHPESFDVIGEEQQKFYNKITRVLINYFLRDEFLCSVLTSKRMDKTKTFLHISVLRRIRNTLTSLLIQQGNSF